MAENVNPTRPVEAGLAEFGMAVQVTQTKPSGDDIFTRAAQSDTAANTTSREVEAKGETTKSLSNLSLKFQVDEDTHSVTVLILDPATKKVVRSIPPEEMNKMDPGELLQLFA